MRTATTLLLLLWLLYACKQEPTNPDEYLQDFTEFIESCEDHHIPLYADETFLYFSRNLYDRFYDEMTTKEKRTSWALRLRYLNLKMKGMAKNTWEEMEDYVLSSQ